MVLSMAFLLAAQGAPCSAAEQPFVVYEVKAGDTVVCFGDSLTFGSGVKGAGTTEGEAYPAVLRRLFEQRGRTAPGTP